MAYYDLPEGFVTAGEAAAHLLNGEHLKDYTPTGLCAVDSIMGGLRKGNLILLAGRPGMGKTQFSLNIAYNAAKASGKKAVFGSYECSSEQIASRALWMLTGISPSVIQGHYGTPLDTLKQRITDAANELGDTPLIVHSADIQTVGQLKNDLMDIDDIGLVVIDYLQLLETERKLESRIAGIKDILAQLKLTAKELNVPIIVNCQIGRMCENRSDKRPFLTDIGYGGIVDRYADDILFLYKESYYREDYDEDTPGECIIAKSHNGITGIAKWRFKEGKYTDV